MSYCVICQNTYAFEPHACPGSPNLPPVSFQDDKKNSNSNSSGSNFQSSGSSEGVAAAMIFVVAATAVVAVGALYAGIIIPYKGIKAYLNRDKIDPKNDIEAGIILAAFWSVVAGIYSLYTGLSSVYTTYTRKVQYENAEPLSNPLFEDEQNTFPMDYFNPDDPAIFYKLEMPSIIMTRKYEDDSKATIIQGSCVAIPTSQVPEKPLSQEFVTVTAWFREKVYIAQIPFAALKPLDSSNENFSCKTYSLN